MVRHPRTGDLARIACPVFGFYRGNDARSHASIPKVTDLMKAAAKSYEPVIYDGAGHGFMRAGKMPPPAVDAGQKALDDFAANKKARDEGWKRVKAILGRIQTRNPANLITRVFRSLLLPASP
jgi:carboxymethylenebutenolidase